MGRGNADERGSLRTRSHSRGDPAWTVQDMLALVNVIAMVEGDCKNAFSSYQKWSMIAENCTAFDVVRNSNQCRRRWESLLAEYKAVKEWEVNPVCDSYWSLDCEMRKVMGLPVDLDKDLYQAIDTVMKLQGRADSDAEIDLEAYRDPEIDSEATDVDLPNVEESGPKRKRQRHGLTHHKRASKGKKQLLLEDFERPVLVREGFDCLQDLTPSKRRRRSAPQKRASEGKGKLVLEEEFDRPMLIGEELEQILVNPKSKMPKHFPQKRSTEGKFKLVSDEELEKSMIAGDEMKRVVANSRLKSQRHWLAPQKTEEQERPLLDEEFETLVHVGEETSLIYSNSIHGTRNHWPTPHKYTTDEMEQLVLHEGFEKPVLVGEELQRIPVSPNLVSQKPLATPGEEGKLPTGEGLEKMILVEEMERTRTDSNLNGERHWATPWPTEDKPIPVLDRYFENPTMVGVGREQITANSELDKQIQLTPHNCKIEDKETSISEENFERPMLVSEEKDHILTEDMAKGQRSRPTFNTGKKVKPSKPRKGLQQAQQPMTVGEENPEPKRQRRRSKKQAFLEEEFEVLVPVVESLAERLKDDTEQIHAILADNCSDFVDDDDYGHGVEDEEALNRKRARHKADKLIACLQELAKNLGQVCDVVEQC